MTFLFADVRGSTTMAEEMGIVAFRDLMNRFYEEATKVLVESHAFIDKFVGDEVVAIFLPVFTGANHALPAVEAAQELLRATGHADPDGPWVPIGVGINSGSAYFGTIKGSQDTLMDLTALGDPVNVAARLASRAKQGEVLLTEDTARLAKLAVEGLKQRRLRLKGKSQPVSVRVLTEATRAG